MTSAVVAVLNVRLYGTSKMSAPISSKNYTKENLLLMKECLISVACQICIKLNNDDACKHAWSRTWEWQDKHKVEYDDPMRSGN